MLEFFEFEGRDGVEPEASIVFHALEGLLVAVLVGDQDVEDEVVVVVDVGVELFALALQVLVKLLQLRFLVVVVLHLSEKVKPDALLICRTFLFLD